MRLQMLALIDTDWALHKKGQAVVYASATAGAIAGTWTAD
jgi:hypothetical protein